MTLALTVLFSDATGRSLEVAAAIQLRKGHTRTLPEVVLPHTPSFKFRIRFLKIIELLLVSCFIKNEK